MSVPNQTPYNIYTANGLTTVFTYEFYIISASDLQVSINGSVVTSGYTVAGVGNKDGGDITFLTPPASGGVVMLERVVPTYRLTDYQDNGDLLADTVNKDFDRLWMAIQRAFIDLGFALTRPFFGGPFNAKGYRIENLADPVNDQDAATKKFVLAADNINFVRTLRVPESFVDVLPSVAARRNSILGFNSSGRPVPIFSMTDTADLAIKLASESGSDLVGYRFSSVFDRLSSLLSLADIGVKRPYLGIDESNDAIIANMFAGDKDFDYMGIGSISLGKKLTGIRRNGVVLSLRGNQQSGDLFNPLISGVANSRGLRAYSSNGTDGVTLYGDISSLPYASWEDVESATYTVNSITPSDPDTWINAKIGDVIYTKHSTPCNGFITAKNSDGTLSVDEWANSGTTTTTPTDGTGFYLNPQNKLWTGNFNLFLPENGRATKGVIVEAGVRNNKTDNSSEINGFDTIVLGGLYDCTAAYLSRGSGGKNWKIGFMSQGAKQSNFLSYAGVYAPRIGFFDQSGAAVGLRLMNTNTVASFELMNLTNDMNHSEEATLVRWDTDGRVRKQALSISVVSTSVTLTSLVPNITVTALGITITLPTSSLLITGHPIRIRVLGAGELYFSSADGLLVEGFSTYTLHTVTRGEYTAIYDGNSWVIFGPRGS